ncbi:MAG TPA: hypothetical protein VD866_08070 [Urbifossiella sp.]|nr:hypothetical protein [Urbifossiella sp.]
MKPILSLALFLTVVVAVEFAPGGEHHRHGEGRVRHALPRLWWTLLFLAGVAFLLAWVCWGRE